MSSIVVLHAGDKNVQVNAFQYPAGEWQVRLKPETITEVEKASEVRIIANIRSADELMRLLLLHDAVANTSHSVDIRVIMPYLPYARADRRFVKGDCDGLSVFTSLLGGLDITTLDVHNPKALIKGYSIFNVSPMILIHRAIHDFAARHHQNKLTVLFPDAGAKERYTLPAVIGGNHGVTELTVLNCTKVRDPETGQFLKFDVPEVPADQPILIVDDLCDGGGTFEGIAALVNRKDIGLYVSHGIFSKGLGKLHQLFDKIYTTNSYYQDQMHKTGAGHIQVYNCLPLLMAAIPSA